MTGYSGGSGTINFIVTLKTEMHRILLPRGTGQLGFLGNLLSDGCECLIASHFDFAECEHGMTVRSPDKGWVSSIFPSGSQPDGRETKTLPSFPLACPSSLLSLSSCLNHFEPILWIESADCSYIWGNHV